MQRLDRVSIQIHSGMTSSFPDQRLRSLRAGPVHDRAGLEAGFTRQRPSISMMLIATQLLCFR
jgi:hypothetical protein